MDLLLAEDDVLSRHFLTEVLTAAGHTVSAVSDGQQALERLRDQRFDLILLDLGLPRVDGESVLQQLRNASGATSNQGTDAAVPAVALSADVDPQRERRLLDLGFEQVIAKPVSGDALLHALSGLRQSLPAAANPAGGLPPLWDDAAGLAMVGGRRAALEALRGLLLQELPAQQQRLAAAFAGGEWRAAAAELHRLRAACGFCGAARLRHCADALDGMLAAGLAPPAYALQSLLACCGEVLQSGNDSEDGTISS
jgi:CheY-like chemotaxis protein